MTAEQIEQTYRGIIASERQRIRAEAIEECARLIETCDGELHAYRQHLAAVIRALKDKL